MTFIRIITSLDPTKETSGVIPTKIEKIKQFVSMNAFKRMIRKTKYKQQLSIHFCIYQSTT